MIREMILPQLSMGMSEGSIVEWLVKEGDRVEADQPVVAIETEKTIADLPAPYGGFLHLVAKSGEKLAVETLIATIAETAAEYQAQLGAAGAEEKREVPAAQAVAQPSLVTTGERKSASGAAKALAREHGVDLAKLSGSGPGGRIERRDVLTAIEGTAAVASPGTMASRQRSKAKVPLTGIRGKIAERMLAASTHAAQTSLFFEIDVTNLLALRQRLADGGVRSSLISWYLRAVAMACGEVPICNATLENDEVTLWENVNAGIAVALPGRGPYDSALAVPVLHDVQAKTLVQIDAEARELIRRTRAGGLTVDDTSNGTITVATTDGFYPDGWMVSAPMLNLPQVVAFQPGTAVEKPVVVAGQIVVRTMLPCGVTYDHRALDGEVIGRFVRSLRDLLTEPNLLQDCHSPNSLSPERGS